MADPKVSVLCTAYNQAQFIAQTIESFLMQETDFEYEILVHDDCSTDGTTEIVRDYEARYPGKVIGMYEEVNTYYQSGGRYFSRLMAPVARGTYVAYCEGDDYWSDPNKLQLQYDYMEANPDCVGCCTSAVVIDGTTGERLGRSGPLGGDRDITFEESVLTWPGNTEEGLWRIPTASMFVRRELSASFATDWPFKTPIGDSAFCMYLTSKGRLHYIDVDTCVYRWEAANAWTSYVRRNLSNKRYDSIVLNYELSRIQMSRNVDEATGGAYHDIMERDLANHAYYLAYTVGPVEFAKTYAGELGKYLTPTKWIKATLVWIYFKFRRLLFRFGIEIVNSPFTGMSIQRSALKVDVSRTYEEYDLDGE